MLCAPVFIFTSGSSALLGHPSCGFSVWLSLVAIFSTLFWVYVNFFYEKTDKTHFHFHFHFFFIFIFHFHMIPKWPPMVIRQANINTERASLILSLPGAIFSFNLSPEIYHTVWRTWHLITCSDEHWLDYQVSLHHSYICSWMVRRICILSLGVKGWKHERFFQFNFLSL